MLSSGTILLKRKAFGKKSATCGFPIEAFGNTCACVQCRCDIYPTVILAEAGIRDPRNGPVREAECGFPIETLGNDSAQSTI
jgi:hypothetical protein